MYLHRRRRIWYALHDIPADVRQALGRARFVKSLETEDKGTAQRRAAVLEVRWRSEIKRARSESPGHIERDAHYWRSVLQEAPEPEKELVRSLIADEAVDRVNQAAAAKGITDVDDPAYMELPEQAEMSRFHAIATGKVIRLEEHLEEWMAMLTNEPKSKDMKRSTVKMFAKAFPHVSDVRRKGIQRWVNKLAQDGKKAATIRRALSELKGYWSYLMSIEAVSEDAWPFEKLSVPKSSGKESGDDVRKPFEPQAVVKLLQAAKEKGDKALADLIRLGMWTGARIEELCALKIENVSKGHFEIVDAKTASGRRLVPIHSKLKPEMRRMIMSSTDGYVLSGLPVNKYGDRSNALGKRFGRLKTAAGFGPEHVFHSIRKTVATILENAGVRENVAADIIGHDKPTLTYGLYSGGASLAVKRDAIEKIGYPGE